MSDWTQTIGHREFFFGGPVQQGFILRLAHQFRDLKTPEQARFDYFVSNWNWER